MVPRETKGKDERMFGGVHSQKIPVDCFAAPLPTRSNSSLVSGVEEIDVLGVRTGQAGKTRAKTVLSSTMPSLLKYMYY